MSAESNQENEKDKTVIFNSASERKKSPESDATKIESDGSKSSNASQAEPKATASGNSDGTKNTGNDASKDPSLNDLKEAGKTAGKGVSSGAFVGGVAAAAAAGVAAGTVFSDDIKGVFEASTYDAPDSPEAEQAEVIDAADQAETTELPETALAQDDNGTADFVANQSATDAASLDSDQANGITLEVSDENGIYEVSILDSNDDGVADVFTADAELVDGSSIVFSATGDSVQDFLNTQELNVADVNDYIHESTSGEFEAFMPESLGAESYEIQPGDTLSEIAAAHNTSIGDLLALNPQIEDANVIGAGQDIIIPIGDNDTNPYAGWSPTESEPEVQIDDSPLLAHDDSQYSEVDWASFEDQPVDEYSSSLSDTDFSSFDTPDCYLASSNDLDSLDFL